MILGHQGAVADVQQAPSGLVGGELVQDGLDEYVELDAVARTHEPCSWGISVYIDSLATTAEVLAYATAGFGARYNLLVLTTGAIRVVGYDAVLGASGRRADTAAGVITAGAWYRIAVVHDRGTADPVIYVDAVAKSSTPANQTCATTLWPLVGRQSTSYCAMRWRDHWYIADVLTSGEVSALDAELAADDVSGAGALLAGNGAYYRYWPVLDTDNGTGTSGSIEDLAGISSATPINTEAGDLVTPRT